MLPCPRSGKKRAERRLDQDPVRDVADTGAGPVAEGGEEADIGPEAGPRIRIDAGIEIGLAIGQSLKHEAQHQHARTGDGPGDERPVDAGRLRKVARDRKHAGADHAANHHRGQRHQRELLFVRILAHRGTSRSRRSALTAN